MTVELKMKQFFLSFLNSDLNVLLAQISEFQVSKVSKVALLRGFTESFVWDCIHLKKGLS